MRSVQKYQELSRSAPSKGQIKPFVGASEPSLADKEGRPVQVYVGRYRFETITPNPVKIVTEEPVSTFSIDVDIRNRKPQGKIR